MAGPHSEIKAAAEPAPAPRKVFSRRRLIAGGAMLAVLGVGGGVTLDLVSKGILPGQSLLDEIDGACSLPTTKFTFAKTLGPVKSGGFYSRARGQQVGWQLAYPPGHSFGDELPLIVALPPYGATHLHALLGPTLAQAVGMLVGGEALTPMAIVAADVGKGYLSPRPGDDPMAMLVDELIPMCQRLGLGRPPMRIGTLGISMGGYGAILVAEHHPQLISAVAAISPAIWTSYAQAKAANPTAYWSAAAFAANDAVTLAPRLRGIPLRVASGNSDPFHAGVVAFVQAYPGHPETAFTHGCHSGPFFLEQEPPSMAFLAAHLSA
jgi:pimeloyl-ACP methyl ester carboxylesterase